MINDSVKLEVCLLMILILKFHVLFQGKTS